MADDNRIDTDRGDPDLTPDGPDAAAGLATSSDAAAAARRGNASRFVVMGIRGTSLALAFVVQVVMARTMSLSAFGAASTALALMNIAMIPASHGYEMGALRYVALNRENVPLLRGMTVMFGRDIGLASAVTAVCLAIIAAVQLTVGHRETGIAVAMLVVIVPGFALVNVGEGWLRGFGSLVRAMINNGVVIPVVSIALLLIDKVTFAAGTHVTTAEAMFVRLVATFVAVVSVSFFVWAKLGRRAKPREIVEPKLVAEIRHASWVLCGIGLLGMILTQAGVVAVAVLSGSADAGVYNAAVRAAQATSVALVAINFTLAPRVARLYAGDRGGDLQTEVSSASGWSTVIMLAACAVLIPGSTLILGIFGAGFGAGSTALRILMLGQLVNALTGPVGVVLQMTGRQVQAIKCLGIAVAVDLILFLLLIPLFGIMGAAIATTTAAIAQNAAMLFYVWQDLSILSLPGPVVRLMRS